MAPPEATDSGVGLSFGLEVDGVLTTMLTEVSGLRLERDVIELKENGPDGTVQVKRLPGQPKAGEVGLTRLLTADTTFETWAQDSSLRGASGGPGTVTIVVFDAAGLSVRRYTLIDAWPSKLEIGALSVAPAPLTERLVLSFEATQPG